MRPTSSWVKERPSQYLIYLVIISNSQPRSKFLHIEKKKFKISKQKYIYIYTYTLILLTNLIPGSVKLIWYIFQIWNPSNPLLLFCRGPFICSHTFGEVYLIATKQNIFLQNSWLPLFSGFTAFNFYRFQLSLAPFTPQIFRDSISALPNEKIENLRSNFPWTYIIRDQFRWGLDWERIALNFLSMQNSYDRMVWFS